MKGDLLSADRTNFKYSSVDLEYGDTVEVETICGIYDNWNVNLINTRIGGTGIPLVILHGLKPTRLNLLFQPV